MSLRPEPFVPSRGVHSRPGSTRRLLVGGLHSARMPRRAAWSRDAVREAAARQLGLITAAQLRELGVPTSTVTWSEQQVGGMFTYVLPGVHAVEKPGALSDPQRAVAAQLYAGPRAVLTGAAVLRARGVRSIRSAPDVHVLVEHSSRRSSTGFVIAERTVHLPTAYDDGLVKCASLARAVMDACRRMTVEDDVRALIFEVVQRGLVSPEALNDERIKGQIRGSRFARLALEQVFAGARSVPEGDLIVVLDRNGLGHLLRNPRLYAPEGEFIACPDAYDPETGVCLEVDSREHHFAVASWEATMARHARMTALGLAVLHAPPSRIYRDGDGVAAEVLAAIRAREGHPRPAVVVRSAEREMKGA